MSGKKWAFGSLSSMLRPALVLLYCSQCPFYLRKRCGTAGSSRGELESKKNDPAGGVVALPVG